ncbi:MAG: hypothetical protein DSY59_04020 [Persephonella sp.]|nr:MAG: hypothetical protein DSY59_04020 [Persephonella sp.]
MGQFEVVLNLAKDQLKARCKVPKTYVASAVLHHITKGDIDKANDLIINETVLNKKEIEPLFEKYPLAKFTLATKIMERLGLTSDVLIREIEEQKN